MISDGQEIPPNDEADGPACGEASEGPLAWSEAFEVGVPELDADHRAIVDKINRACAAVRSGERGALLAYLVELQAMAMEHFAREEAVLAPFGDDHCGHAREHAHRLDQLGRLHAEVAAMSDPPNMRHVCEQMMDWFVKQAVGYDARIKGYFKERS